MSTHKQDMIWLQSNDNSIIRVERDVAERSVVIRNLLQDIGDESISEQNPIPILKVNGVVLKKVLKWCKRHRNDDVSILTTTKIDEWDHNFMRVDQEMLFEIILAANYLEIKDLLDAGCKTVSNIIRGATPTDLLRNCDIANGFDGRGGRCPEEIRRAFNITNDFTAEEEEQIRRENDWAGDS